MKIARHSADEFSRNYQGKRILITGGTGYLASAIISRLKTIDCKIVCLDRKKFSYELKDTVAEIIEIEGDVTRADIWGELLPHADLIFHFAAQTSVYVANDDPVKDLNINVYPIINILETCRKQNLKPVILFSGTATEAGIPERLPVDESHPDRPVTIYDLHKLTSENYLRSYVNQGFVNGAILRLANVYGPGPSSSSAGRGVLNIMIRRALNGEDLMLYGEGNLKRDYVYIDDVARAFLIAGTRIDIINGRYFVIGSGQACTLKEAFDLVAKRVALKTGKKVKVVSIEPPASLSPIENRNFIANSRNFSELTDWNPVYSLEKGIDSTIDSFQPLVVEQK